MEKCKRGITLCLAVLFLILLLPIPRASAATVEEQVQEKIRWIIASIPDDCDTDYEKALWLHDYLCETVTYKKGLSDYAYTALLDGVADCGGYADAYRRLLLAVGIRCGTVSGYATDEPHAWNIIWLDGKCYFSDVCWDDDPKLKFHDYFMISFEQMAEDHQANGIQDAAGEFSHPCNHNEYGNAYIGQYGNDIPKFTNNTTPEETKEYFKVTKVNGSVVTVFCDFRFDGNAENWVRSNKLPIGRMFGNSVYSRVTIGDEGYGILQYDVHDYAFTATQSISFAQVTVSLNNSHMRQQLSVNFAPADASFQEVTYSSSDSRIVKVDKNGVVHAISSGTATITATAIDGKTATCQVVVDHKHDAIHAVAAVAANCLNKGYKAHYICDSCGTRFSDSKGKNVVSLMDVVTPPTKTHGPYYHKYNDEKHCNYCVICDFTHGVWQYHEDEDGDGWCDYDCGYVMDPSATKPATKPSTKPATKPETKPATKPETKPVTSTPIVPETSSATTSFVATVPDSTPPATQSTAATENTVPGSAPSENTSAPVEMTQDEVEVTTIRWIVFGLSVVTVVAVVIWELRKRKKR